MDELKKWIDGKSKWNMSVYILSFIIGIGLIIYGSTALVQAVGIILAFASGYGVFHSQPNDESK
jgi:ABC-type multidrug transport system permease subunit